MQDFIELYKLTELPQEIVHEIFDFVPEYGHRVCLELHERSKTVRDISAYCDFLRYCTRLSDGPIDVCVKVMGSDNLSGDIKIAAIRYLKKNLRGLVSMYLDDHKLVTKNVLRDLGVVLVDRISSINCGYYDSNDVYKLIEWRSKVIELYSLMIIRDAGLMTKKEFNTACSGIIGIEVTLELVFSLFEWNEHIYRVAIRYFASEPIMADVIRRLDSWAAVDDGILYDIDYSYDSVYLRKYMDYNDISKKMDRGNLQEIRDQILMSVPNDAYCRYSALNNVDIQETLFMLESLADED